MSRSSGTLLELAQDIRYENSSLNLELVVNWRRLQPIRRQLIRGFDNRILVVLNTLMAVRGYVLNHTERQLTLHSIFAEFTPMQIFALGSARFFPSEALASLSYMQHGATI